ncbi:unnamed protein product [Oppiella nova]|uniref:Uncharacterized protein n=1 Tax=Oppiella nova TaxID=334625 RepID=A0A7R9QDJ7_9ACAR|nr:unnamed protein product [Oppiella nova]CAG2163169.1 unnamed protein product [Oppiella nova]
MPEVGRLLVTLKSRYQNDDREGIGLGLNTTPAIVVCIAIQAVQSTPITNTNAYISAAISRLRFAYVMRSNRWHVWSAPTVTLRSEVRKSYPAYEVTIGETAYAVTDYDQSFENH